MSNLHEKWELAISHYLSCHNWVKVADKLGMSHQQVYKWTYEKEFQIMLEKERQRIIQENCDRLRSFTKETDDNLMKVIRQDNDLSAKLQAIKEFNRKFEWHDSERRVDKSNEMLEEIRDNVKNIKSSES